MELFFIVFFALWACAATGTLIAVFTNTIPFPDRGSTVLTCPNDKAKSVIVTILRNMGISKPMGVADDALVTRVIMSDLTVFNVTNPQLFKKLGEAGGARIYAVKDPKGSAKTFAMMARVQGYTATIHEEISGAGTPVVLVSTDLLVSNLIGFRLHVTKMPRLKPWAD